MRSSIIMRNAKNSARDYVIYFITIAFSLSLVYAFNLIIFSKEIIELSSGMNALSFIVVCLSVIVVLVIGWLIHYMARFMLEKRSREFGTYMLLGVPGKTITTIFIRENLIMGAVAFAGAILLGTALYQILFLIIMNLFHASYGIGVYFSVQAVLMTLLYTLLMYGIAMIKMYRYIRNLEIHDLMDMDRNNENAANRSRKHAFRHFLIYAAIEVLSILLYYVTCCKNPSPDIVLITFFVSLAGILVGVYGIYTTLTAFIAKTALSDDAYKYRKNRLFLLRGLTARLGTIGKTMGTLALLMTLTLAATQLGVLFERFFDAQYRGSTGFEVAVSSVAPDEDLSSVVTFLDEKYGIAFQYDYPLYLSETDPLYDYMEMYGYIEGTPVLAASDFYRLWGAMAYPEITLEQGKYILIGNDRVKDTAVLSGMPDIIIGGQTLILQECRNESFNTGSGFNGTGYMIVIDDALAQTLPIYHHCLAINTKSPTVYSEIKPLLDSVMGDSMAFESIDSFVVRADKENNKSSLVVSLAFSLFFIGLIFACTAATILAVHQLSDALRHKYRYDILSKLGMGPEKIGRLIFKQTLLYFIIPIVLPFPLSVLLSYGVNSWVLTGMIAPLSFLRAAFLSLGLFIIVYFMYFIATYLGYKRRVM